MGSAARVNDFELAKRAAAGICCMETTFGDAPIGAICVLERTVRDVLRDWRNAGALPVLLKGHGWKTAAAISPETRVVVIRVIQRAVLRPREEEA